MMDQKKPLLQLLALLLFLSCLLLPLGSLALGNTEPQFPELTDQVMIGEGRMMEEEVARKDIESNDYPGSGANNHHDPRSPGRA